MQRYLFHSDDVSWAAYPYPVKMVEVVSMGPPDVVPAPRILGTFRSARDSDAGLRAFGAIQPFVKDGRVIPAGHGVLTWTRMPRRTAPAVLLQALPRYWTSRFPITRDTRPLTTSVTASVDINSLNARRQADRNALVQHAGSLEQKLLSLNYHRANFGTALTALRDGGLRLFELVRASAEYNAILACIYSILEEFAAVISLLRRMAGRKGSPLSFSDLRKSKDASLPTELKELLKAPTWYERFHARRTNATHGFGVIVQVPSDQTEPFIFQNPEARFYDAEAGPAPAYVKAWDEVDYLMSEFEQFVARLSEHLLSYFHHWDTVTLLRSDSFSSAMEKITIWVRNIYFTTATDSSAGWALVDGERRIHCKVDAQGLLAHGTQLPLEDGS